MRPITDWGTLVTVLGFLGGILAITYRTGQLVSAMKELSNLIKDLQESSKAMGLTVNEHTVHLAHHDEQIKMLFSKVDDK